MITWIDMTYKNETIISIITIFSLVGIINSLKFYKIEPK